MDSNECTFALIVYNAKTCIFYWARNKGCSKFKAINGTKLKLQKGHEVVLGYFNAYFIRINVKI